MTEKAVKFFVTMRCLMICKDENCTPALGRAAAIPRFDQAACVAGSRSPRANALADKQE
jgi:hypothetical protein